MRHVEKLFALANVALLIASCGGDESEPERGSGGLGGAVSGGANQGGGSGKGAGGSSAGGRNTGGSAGSAGAQAGGAAGENAAGDGGVAGNGGAAGAGAVGGEGGAAGDGGVGGEGGAGDRACLTPGNDLIYLLDDAARLLSFNPRLIGSGEPYAIVGQLACPNPGTSLFAGGGPALPFSLSVDRQGKAWVLYTSGQLYTASIEDAECEGTAFTQSQDTGGQVWDAFRMAFTSDTALGNAETLWIAGGNTDGSMGSLGSIAGGTLGVSSVGAIGPTADLPADLTGIYDATLWGFFPNLIADAFIQQIDRSNGAGVFDPMTFDLVTAGEQLVAWSFAHWGGKFYVFVTGSDGLNSNSRIHTVDRSDGMHSVILQDQAHVAVAAGVATCAPIAEP